MNVLGFVQDFLYNYHYDFETKKEEISLNVSHSGFLQIKVVIYGLKSSI